jgi:hypothetical protein
VPDIPDFSPPPLKYIDLSDINVDSNASFIDLISRNADFVAL